MDFNKENLKKIRGLILFTVLVLVVLWNYKLVFRGAVFVWNVILPFVLGGVIAFIINIPMGFIEEKIFGKRKKKWAKKIIRPLCLFITIIGILGILATVIWVVAPELTRTIWNLESSLKEFIPEVQTWILRNFENNKNVVAWVADLDKRWDEVFDKVLDFVAFGSTYEMARNIISGVVTFTIAFAFACYVLMQKEKLGEQIKKIMCAFLPEDWREIFFALGKVIHKSFTSFFTGQCLESVILGVMFLAAMLILRLPYALLISVVIAITALVPIFGSFVGCAVGFLLIFIINPVKAFIFIGVFLLLQQIEGDFIYPHVVGKSVGLPSIWVLVAVTVGANLMGVTGMLIFIPITSVIYTMFRGIVNRRLGLKE